MQQIQNKKTNSLSQNLVASDITRRLGLEFANQQPSRENTLNQVQVVSALKKSLPVA